MRRPKMLDLALVVIVLGLGFFFSNLFNIPARITFRYNAENLGMVEVQEIKPVKSATDGTLVGFVKTGYGKIYRFYILENPEGRWLHARVHEDGEEAFDTWDYETEREAAKMAERSVEIWGNDGGVMYMDPDYITNVKLTEKEG